MANHNKAKGSNVERELIAMFWNAGWGAVRIAGSGGSQFPNPDVLASNKIRRIAVECKFVNDNKKYFSKEDIAQLEMFAEKFGAEAWLGIKFSRKNWYFIKTNELNSTGEMFIASLEICKEKGKEFNELVN